MKSGKLFKMENGIPVPVDDDPLTKEQLQALTPAALALPYEPLTDAEGIVLLSERKFQNNDGSWMSKVEVAAIRDADSWSHGNWEAGKEIKDRMLGKPKQQVEQLTITSTLENFLNRVQQNEQRYLAQRPAQQALPQYTIEIPISDPSEVNIDDII